MYQKRSKTAEILVFFVFFPGSFLLIPPTPELRQIAGQIQSPPPPLEVPYRKEERKEKVNAVVDFAHPSSQSGDRPTDLGRKGQLRIQTQPVEMGVVGGGGVLEKRVVEIEEEEENEFKWRRRVPSPFLFPSAEEVMLSS